MEIQCLDKYSLNEILDAFESAFSDYAVKFNRDELAAMWQRRGLSLGMSFGAVDNGRIVSFILNGVGEYGGVKCCYDCGTGTAPEYRGQGLAAAVFDYSIPHLAQAGYKAYLLEVLKDNAPAIALYRKAGFDVRADYDCYKSLVSNLELTKECAVDTAVQDIPVEDMNGLFEFADFEPSWQNSPQSLFRGRDGLIFKGAFVKNELAGGIAFDPKTGDIAALIVKNSLRRRGIARKLLREALVFAEISGVKVLNVDVNSASTEAFLEKIGFEKGLSQYAMMKFFG